MENSVWTAQTKLTEIPMLDWTQVLLDVFIIAPQRLQTDYPEDIGGLAEAARLPVGDVIALVEKTRLLEQDIEMPPEELAADLAKGEDILLVDVREPWEFEICALPGSHLLRSETFPELLPKMQQAKTVVAICHHGVRSYSAAMYFRGEGLSQTRSLTGGVEAWALTIDPDLPRY